MNHRAYTLDASSAKAADTPNGRITETGKYVGDIVSAKLVTSNSGTEGVEISFKSSLGQTADFLTLWTHNKDGKELFGLKVLNAIMACLQLRGITPRNGMVEEWDSVSKSRVRVSAVVFPELHAPIGLLLQREQYIKGDGKVGEKLNIVAPFQYGTELTASEILNRVTKPEVLAKLVGQLKDKTLPKSNGYQGDSYPTPGSPPAQQSAHYEDDIPF